MSAQLVSPSSPLAATAFVPLSMRLLLPCAALLLAGCAAVGPDYQRPTVQLDTDFIGAPNAQPVADIASFWSGFSDARLNELIDRALAVNGDIKLAQARLQEARANQDDADAAQRPNFGIDTSATRAIRPITQQPAASRAARTGDSFDASFIANWEIDLFGRLRRSSEAAAAQTDSSIASVVAMQTSVAAEVARNYLELRGLQQRIQFTEASLIHQRDTLKLTRARLESGRGTELDLARAQSLVASTEAALPPLQTSVERTIFRLATLTAQPLRTLLAGLAAPAPLPCLPVTDLATLPAGTPEQWLQRRPDIIVAERQLAAATAGIGIARSALYPRVSLSGLLGLNAASIGDLAKGDSVLYSLGTGLTWTPFDLGTIRARIHASEARVQQSLSAFENAISAALEETEGAFSSFTRNAQRVDKLEVATRSAAEAVRLSRFRYEVGVTDFLVVLDAERELLLQRDELVRAQVDMATSLVAVYRSLGGGWSTPQAKLENEAGLQEAISNNANTLAAKP